MSIIHGDLLAGLAVSWYYLLETIGGLRYPQRETSHMPIPFAPPQGSVPYQSFDKLELGLSYAHERKLSGNPLQRIDRKTIEPAFGRDYEAYGFVGAIRRFGGMEADGTPTKLFWELADPASRKAALTPIIQRTYATVIEVAKKPDATRKQVEEAITREFGITGSTRVKAAGFFIAAAAYTDIYIAPVLIQNALMGKQRRTEPEGSESPAPRHAVADSGTVPSITGPEEEAMYAARAPSLATLPVDGSNEVAERVLYHVKGLAGILPGDGKWNQVKRDKWVQAVTSMLDAIIEVEEADRDHKPTGAHLTSNGFVRP